MKSSPLPKNIKRKKKNQVLINQIIKRIVCKVNSFYRTLEDMSVIIKKCTYSMPSVLLILYN